MASRADSLVPAIKKSLRAWSRTPEHLRLFSISKNMPQSVMTELVSSITHTQQTHVGTLSEPLHPGTLSQHASSMQGPLYSVALARMPASQAIAFRSVIPGAPRIAVGRWPEQKETWHADPTARTKHLDETGHWAPLWGRQNVERRIPVELESFARNPSDIHAFLLFSDAFPQGLLEGLDSHFPNTSLLGTVAAYTPFETGREHTLFYGTSTQGVYEKGAVGIAFRSSARLERTLGGLVSIGPRLAITGAQGNIISSLDHHNATQQLIRLITGQQKARGEAVQDPQAVRAMASHVRKDDDVFLGVYAHPEDDMPLTITRIQSGHPMRGTLCIDADIELGGPQKYAQVYRNGHERSVADPFLPASIRYIVASGNETATALQKAKTPLTRMDNDLASLEHTFLVASDKGWFGRASTSFSSPAHTYAIPHTSASLAHSLT